MLKENRKNTNIIDVYDSHLHDRFSESYTFYMKSVEIYIFKH